MVMMMTIMCLCRGAVFPTALRKGVLLFLSCLAGHSQKNKTCCTLLKKWKATSSDVNSENKKEEKEQVGIGLFLNDGERPVNVTFDESADTQKGSDCSFFLSFLRFIVYSNQQH